MRVEVDALRDGVHRQQHPAERAIVAGGEGHDVLGDLAARLGVEAADDAEVEEAERAVVEQHEVAGVHVAVEEAVEDHRTGTSSAGRGPAWPRCPRRGARMRCHVVDAHAVEALHGEDARAWSARGSMRGARTSPWPSSSMMRLNSSMLAASRRKSSSSWSVWREVLDDADGVGQLDGGDERDDLRDEAHDAHVGGDAALDVRALDLDHDLAAVVEARGVHLRDRGRGERRGIDLGEELRRGGRASRGGACARRRRRRTA